MRDIFISHSSLDKMVTKDICVQLENAGFSCWLSYRIEDLKPGEFYTKEIKEAIANSRIFIVLLSKNSVCSKQVQQEVILANERQRYGIKIFPVIIDEDIDVQNIHSVMDYVFAGSEKIFWNDKIAQKELIGQVRKCLECSVTKEKAELISNLPENSKVFGREQDLENISRIIERTGKVCVNGLGGIGKTALLQTFCNIKYEKKYTKIVYLPIENCLLRTLANDSLFKLRSDGIDKKKEVLSEYEYALYKLSLLENSVDDSTLVVLDNVESQNDPFLQRICHLSCDVIVVTRYLEIAEEGFETYLVKEIEDVKELHALFELHFGSKLTIEDEEVLDGMLSDVHNHTMTIILLAKQMSYFGKRPSDYLDKNQLRIEREKNLSQILSSKVYNSDIVNMYSQLFDLFAARNLTSVEKKVMKALSLIPTTGMYRHLFFQLIGDECIETVAKLESMGWILSNNEKKLIILHPVVRDVVVHELELHLEDPDISSFFEKFILEISNSWDKNYQENCKLKELALSIYYEFPTPTISKYKSYLILSKYLWVLNCTDISIEIQNKIRMLFVDENGIHFNSTEEAEALLQIGFIYQGIGEYENAANELGKAVKIYGNKFAAALAHLAQAKMCLGGSKLEEVEILHELSLNIRKEYWAGTISEAASCHLYAKTLSTFEAKLDLAIKLEKRAYQIFSELQPGGVNVSSAAYILGWLFVQNAEDEDDIAYGIKKLEEARKIRLEHRGDLFHPWMEDIYLKLSMAYERKDDFYKAKEYLELLLAVRNKKYKGNSSKKEIVSVYEKLEKIYKQLGDLEGEKRCRKFLKYCE